MLITNVPLEGPDLLKVSKYHKLVSFVLNETIEFSLRKLGRWKVKQVDLLSRPSDHYKLGITFVFKCAPVFRSDLFCICQ